MSLTRTAEIYSFIHDAEQIKRFARLIDSSTKLHHLYLCARPKYQSTDDTRLKHNKYMSPRTIFSHTPEELVNVVHRYELEVGAYQSDGKPLPPESLVVYCSTNARDGKKAAKKLVTEIVENAFTDDGDYFNHLYSRFTSCVMSSKEGTRLVTVDIDDKKQYPEVKEFLDSIPLVPEAVIETRGGYHVLLPIHPRLPDVYKKYSKIHEMGDISCPIPGTYQGGFPVRFV